MGSCSEVRDEIIALIPENEIAEEAQRWIDYQRAIDNALDIAQDYIYLTNQFHLGFNRT